MPKDGAHTGQALKRYRKLMELSQEEVAAELGYGAASSVCRIEAQAEVDGVRFAEVVLAMERAKVRQGVKVATT